MLRRTSALGVLLFGLVVVSGDVPSAQSAQDPGDKTPKTDRLTLDLYLDMETVAEPQLSPDGTQIVYTRGWIDKINDKRESALVDHERRRQPQPLPREGIDRALVALWRSHRLHHAG